MSDKREDLVRAIKAKMREHAMAWCAADTAKQATLVEDVVQMVETAGRFGEQQAVVEKSGEVTKPELRAVLPLDRGTPAERRRRTLELAESFGWDPKMNCTAFGYLRAYLEK